MEFISRLFCKLIFSEDSTLNLIPRDLGESMITGQVGKAPVERIPTATGTIGSLNISIPVTLTVSVLKTSPAFQNYWGRILNNGYVGGTCTFYDDANNSHTISEVSVSTDNMPNGNGTEASVEFKVEGNMLVNKQALIGF